MEEIRSETSQANHDDALALLARSRARMNQLQLHSNENDHKDDHNEEDANENASDTSHGEDALDEDDDVIHEGDDVITENAAEATMEEQEEDDDDKEDNTNESDDVIISKPLSLAEEAAELLKASRARLNQDAHTNDDVITNKISYEYVTPLADDEVVESDPESIEEEQEDDDVSISNSSVNSDISHPSNDDVKNSSHDVNSDARAYAAAMLTVANVSSPSPVHDHNDVTHANADVIHKNSTALPSSSTTATSSSSYDKSYIAKLDHLPPSLLNALLHEEAMLAAEKAALEGKDRHVFNLAEVSQLGEEVQQRKEYMMQQQQKNRNGYAAGNVVENIRRWFGHQRDILKAVNLEKEKHSISRKVLQDYDTPVIASNNSTPTRRKAQDLSFSSSTQNNSTPSKSGPSSPLPPVLIKSDDSYINDNTDSNSTYEQTSFSSSNIISYDMITALHHTALPLTLHHKCWYRVYSLTRDGDSFDTFLRKVKGYDKTLVVVKTVLGEVFGGFVDEEWSVKRGDTFYGSGQSLLFKIMRAPTDAKTGTVERNVNNNNDSEQAEETLHLYKWTGQNRYVQLCDSNYKRIAMGGGGDASSFGLCVEDDFRRGSTGPCSTFDNDTLCSNGSNNNDSENNDTQGASFEVLDLEVWGFVMNT